MAIHTSEAPSSPLYSQAVKAGGFIYLSGFVGINPLTKQLAGDTIEEQMGQAIRNCESVLKSAGSGLGDVVQAIVLLSDPTDFDGMNKEYSRMFPNSPPARMVAKLGITLPGVKVSIAMTAAVRDCTHETPRNQVPFLALLEAILRVQNPQMKLDTSSTPQETELVQARRARCRAASMLFEGGPGEDSS